MWISFGQPHCGTLPFHGHHYHFFLDIYLQVLVTHHVELVLPGAQYLVRMLDGRIDTQGPVAELRARGVLDDLYHGVSVQVHEEEQAAAAGVKSEEDNVVEA